MPNEISLSVSLNRPQYPVVNSEQLAYVYLEVAPMSLLPTVANATPLNLSLVLDRSGSMAGQKMHDLKEAAKLVINRLNNQDLISIVMFDEQADIIVPSQPVADKASFLNQIDQVFERGGTQISIGMQAGMAQLQQGSGQGRINRMILLTDGETWEDEHSCRHLATQAQQQGISITALGLGNEWNQPLLTDLAGLSGGHWEYIDTPDKISQAFQHVLTSMQGTVVTQMNLTLRLTIGVHPRVVWRVTPLIDKLNQRHMTDRDVQISLGDLQNNGQSVLVELMFPSRQAGGYRLAQATVSYDVPAQGLINQRVSEDVMVTFATMPAESKQVNGRIMNIVEKVSAFKLMTTALDETTIVDDTTRTRRLRAAATRLLDMGELKLAQQAQDAAQTLESGQKVSASATKRLQSATRKLDINEILK